MNATRRTKPTVPDRASGPAAARADAGPRPMRQQILAIAENLYVLRGYDGFSFGHIAETAQTTRANIHHHFGDKLQLMAELISGFSANAQARIAHHWIAVDGSFDARLQAQLADLRDFYQRFNPQPGDRNVWSPLSRLRLDLQVLGPLAAAALHSVDLEYERCLRRAVNDAIDRNELKADTPVEDVSRLLRMMLLSCAPMTQDSGDFAEVERLFASMRRVIFAAWAPR